MIAGLAVVLTSLFLFMRFKDTRDNEYVMRHEWKSGGGYWAGDWLYFDRSGYYKVVNDTLYKRDTAVATIVNIHKGFYGDNELEIKSLHTGQAGIYHEK